jgi:SAM-dependent methyltransferase
MNPQVKEIGNRVREFYEKWSFPGYEDCEDIQGLVQKANRSMYAKLLDEQIKFGVKILDAGCGTGQLAIFLSLSNRDVLGIDFSSNSLIKGMTFKKNFDVPNVDFVQMDLFHLGLKAESFDIIFSNGVLHHTPDAEQGFSLLCKLLKPGGYFILGLYNTYGRMLLDARRWFFNVTSDRFKALDFFIRQQWMGNRKKVLWYKDQYQHPYEKTYSVGNVLRWFEENDIHYVNSIPKIRFGYPLTPNERLFEKHDPGTKWEHWLKQVNFIFTQSREGGFFITIGKKKGSLYGNC